MIKVAVEIPIQAYRKAEDGPEPARAALMMTSIDAPHTCAERGLVLLTFGKTKIAVSGDDLTRAVRAVMMACRSDDDVPF